MCVSSPGEFNATSNPWDYCTPATTLSGCACSNEYPVGQVRQGTAGYGVVQYSAVRQQREIETRLDGLASSRRVRLRRMMTVKALACTRVECNYVASMHFWVVRPGLALAFFDILCYIPIADAASNSAATTCLTSCHVQDGSVYMYGKCYSGDERAATRGSWWVVVPCCKCNTSCQAPTLH